MSISKSDPHTKTDSIPKMIEIGVLYASENRSKSLKIKFINRLNEKPKSNSGFKSLTVLLRYGISQFR